MRLKHITITLMLLITLLTTKTFSQDSGPQIATPDSVFVFGFLGTDAKIVHEFTIKNLGTDTLFIDTVATDCGCTTAPLLNDVIAPGDSTSLYVYFDPRRMINLIRKRANIFSNDPNFPTKVVTILAICDKKMPYLSFTPEIVNLGRLTLEKLDKTYKCEIKNTSESPIKLKINDYINDYIEAELTDDLLDPGETTNLEIKLIRIPNDPKHYHFSVTLEASIDDASWNVTIPAIGRINVLE